MSILSQKDTRAVLKSLENEGARLVKTKSGVRVLFANGESTVIHWSASDYRGIQNMRSTIIKNGLTWPFDSQQRADKMAINKVGEHLSAAQRIKLAGCIEAYEGQDLAIRDLVKCSEVGIQAVRHALHVKGYSTGRGQRGLWVKLPTEAEKAKDAADQAALEEDLGFHMIPDPEPTYEEIDRARADRELDAEVERRKREAEHASWAIRDPRFVEVNRSADRARVEQVPEPVRFIDDRGSWTVEVPDELITMALAMGLEIEVRVWRA